MRWRIRWRKDNNDFGIGIVMILAIITVFWLKYKAYTYNAKKGLRK